MKRRRCGICGLPGHDRRSHKGSKAKNPQYYWYRGAIHPMRKSYPGKRDDGRRYDDNLAKPKRLRRK